MKVRYLLCMLPLLVPVTVAGAGTPQDRVALTIWGEARGETVKGRQLVASVIWNRAGRRAGSLDRVCKAPAFSCWRGMKLPDMNKPADRKAWQDCQRLARQMREGTFRPLTRATHYHADYCRPYWISGMRLVLRHGRHLFYTT